MGAACFTGSVRLIVMHCGLVHPNVMQCGAMWCKVLFFSVLCVVPKAGEKEKNGRKRRGRRGRSEKYQNEIFSFTQGGCCDSRDQ